MIILRWSDRGILRTVVAACLLATAIAVIFCYAWIFTSSAGKTLHVSRKEQGLFVHRQPIVVWRKNNCNCTNNICPSVNDAPCERTGMIAADDLTSRNVPITNSVPLDTFHTKGNRSLKNNNLVIWSTDHHPAPAYDTRHLLEPLGVKFLQHDLSPYCSFFNLCAERHNLKVSVVLRSQHFVHRI